MPRVQCTNLPKTDTQCGSPRALHVVFQVVGHAGLLERVADVTTVTARPVTRTRLTVRGNVNHAKACVINGLGGLGTAGRARVEENVMHARALTLEVTVTKEPVTMRYICKSFRIRGARQGGETGGH
jgi:hypothetical protein